MNKQIQENNQTTKVDYNCLFSSFKGFRFFEIFYTNIVVLQNIIDWLDEGQDDKLYGILEKHLDVKHRLTIKKIYYILSQHEMDQTAKKLSKYQGADYNSLLYRILYSENTKSRDLILKIVSYSEEFSLSKIFICQADVKQVIRNISSQLIDAFNTILMETSETKQILALKTSPDIPLIGFTSSESKLTQEICEK